MSDASMTPEAALDFARAVFRACGVAEADAATVADILVDADLSGVETHGVMRLPIYVRRFRAGTLNPAAEIKTVRETRSTAVVDGGNGLGQLVAARAMGLAVEKCAREGEPAFVTVRNGEHFGAGSYFAEMPAKRGMIGIAIAASGQNFMAPWGGRDKLLGNNPIAIAMPAGEEPPVVMDMACSVSSNGRLMIARRNGTQVPEGWALDADGKPTTDPHLAALLNPIGGAKGYALALMNGLLATMLSGAEFGSEITRGNEKGGPRNVGLFFGALPIAAFEDPAVYARRMDEAIREIRHSKPADPQTPVRLPGHRRHALRLERRKTGIRFTEGVRRELAAMAQELGVAFAAK